MNYLPNDTFAAGSSWTDDISWWAATTEDELGVDSSVQNWFEIGYSLKSTPQEMMSAIGHLSKDARKKNEN